MIHPADTGILAAALAAAWAVLFAAYLTHAAGGGRLLCRLGFHATAPRRLGGLGGYWLTCKRSCGFLAARSDRRAA